MKLGPVTKLGKRNKKTSKEIEKKKPKNLPKICFFAKKMLRSSKLKGPWH